jgi:preprotein translocase SecF subunit
MYAVLARFGAEIDTLFITAVLTTMSFSVHDTIVMFDKIREYKKTSGLDIEILANKALTETIVRSVNNSLTIILMLVPLTFFGGDAVKFFAAALLIGTVTGTYSSPCIATPLLVLLERRRSTSH